jgi:hypothetical protein
MRAGSAIGTSSSIAPVASSADPETSLKLPVVLGSLGTGRTV